MIKKYEINPEFLDIIDSTYQLEVLENHLKLECSRLIRENLENSPLDFIGGNDLDILIDTNLDIDSIVNHALIEGGE
tara:strand:- start:107 stop:337 length:231 start_codon:yes stop_codon:yes gene_type:complete